MKNPSRIDIKYRVIIYIIFCLIVSIINMAFLFFYYRYYSYIYPIFIFLPCCLCSLILFKYDEVFEPSSGVNRFQNFATYPIISYVIIWAILFAFIDDKEFFSKGNERYYLLFYFIFSSSTIPMAARYTKPAEEMRKRNKKSIYSIYIMIFLILFSSKNSVDTFFHAREVSKTTVSNRLISLFGPENLVSINAFLFSFSLICLAGFTQSILDYRYFGGRTRFFIRKR